MGTRMKGCSLGTDRRSEKSKVERTVQSGDLLSRRIAVQFEEIPGGGDGEASKTG